MVTVRYTVQKSPKAPPTIAIRPIQAFWEILTLNVLSDLIADVKARGSELLIMNDSIAVSESVVIVGDHRITSVRASRFSSMSLFVLSVAMAMISAICLGFSAQMFHMAFSGSFSSLSSIFSSVRSKSNKRLLNSICLPSESGYKLNFSFCPSIVSISKDSYSSSMESMAVLSNNGFAFIVCKFGRRRVSLPDASI